MAKCRVCGYQWEPRRKEPKACPKCKRYDWKEPIKILSIVVFSVLLFPNLVKAASWTTLSQSDFNLGTYFNTTYNSTGSYVMLNNTTAVVYSPFGNYTSKIFDAGTTAAWNNISWIEGVPYGEELPDNNRVEAVLGGANMTGNVLLMHMNGANGSTTFVDNSSGNKAITANDNAYIDTSQSKFGGASGKFDGSGDYLNLSDSSDWYFGNNSFAIDFWVRFKALPDAVNNAYIFSQYVDLNNRYQLQLRYVGPSDLRWYWNVMSGGLAIIDSDQNATVATNTWYHVALVRNGNNFIIFQDGTQVGSTVTDSDAIPDFAGSVFIGSLSGTGNFLNGWLDELAVYKNQSLSAAEILNHYKRGALRLNITTRSCNDAACSGESWNETHTNSTLSNLKEQNNRYFQYKAQFEIDNTSYTPELYNVTINYTIPFIVSSNATTSKRGDFINITITSSSAVSVNITRPNGFVSWLAAPVSKSTNIYETNYTFSTTDPSGSYRIGANSSSSSNTTNVTLNSSITVTIESNRMSTTRNIITRSGNNILMYGTATYSKDNSACPSCTISFTYDSTSAGSNTTNSAGSYNFSFSMSSDGNYSFRVQATDSYNNTGSNSTIMVIRSRPEYVKYRLTFALGTSKTNDVYKIGTGGNTSELIDSITLTNLQYSSNLTHAYVCSYDKTEYTNGLLISLIHSYKSGYLGYVNFSTAAANTNYTLELRNKIDGSNLLLVYTKGTCDTINDKMYMVEKQDLPSRSFATFNYGGPLQYPYEIRTNYDRIQINGSDRWTTGSHKLCIQKTGVSSANKPIVDVGRC